MHFAFGTRGKGKEWTHPATGKKLFLGMRKDGSMWNPNNLDDETVQALLPQVKPWFDRLLAEDAVERKEMAARAAVTRKRRRDANIIRIAKDLIKFGKLEPQANCRSCGKHISDPESQKRGIGPECWQGILQTVEMLKAQEGGQP